MLLLVAQFDADRLLRRWRAHHLRQRLLRRDSIGGTGRCSKAHQRGIRRHLVGLGAESLLGIVEKSAKDVSCAGDA